ncbi:hypothetical protein NDU88_001573 [Pleurodeles waltl]|uniref:Uncharacterized protein n=1 Tax=Pleurodeles waltl TaxID=8319 RepID=A0AAV7T0R2_PLEWA|nr:hypothetical protein NDU88_001573 [Pleurodeles waltl]
MVLPSQRRAVEAWPARWPTGSTSGVLPAPDSAIFAILPPSAPANPADGSWSPWRGGGGRGEHQQLVKGVAIVPQGSTGEERLTPRWRARFENQSKLADCRDSEVQFRGIDPDVGVPSGSGLSGALVPYPRDLPTPCMKLAVPPPLGLEAHHSDLDPVGCRSLKS